MSKVTVTIKGLDSVLGNLKDAPKTIQREGDRAIYKSVELIEAATVPRVPVVTSYLRNNRTTLFRPLFGALKFHADYAGYVHGGTRYQRSQPFLAQGAESVKGKIEVIWKQLGESIVNQLAK